MRRIRGLVYRLGFRPKPGSIFYSPSKDWQLALANFGRDFERAMREAQERMREQG